MTPSCTFNKGWCMAVGGERAALPFGHVFLPKQFMMFTQIMGDTKHVTFCPQKLKQTSLSTEKSPIATIPLRAQGKACLSAGSCALSFYSCPSCMDQLNIHIAYLVTSCISMQGPIMRADLSSSFCFICFSCLVLFHTFPSAFCPLLCTYLSSYPRHGSCIIYYITNISIILLANSKVSLL